MPNENKISEIKIIITGLLQDIDSMSEAEMISSLKWEEILMSASLISQKLNTLRIEQERSHIRKIESELRDIRQKLETPVMQMQQKSAEPVNQPQPPVQVQPQPEEPVEQPQPEEPVEQPQPEEQLLFKPDQEEIELDFFTERIPIMDIARSSKPDWLRDKPGPKIENISSAVTLNDKLFFIKELFKGDEEQYFLSIQKLNSMESFDKALDYTRNAFPDWDESSNAVYRFYMILRRRYNG